MFNALLKLLGQAGHNIQQNVGNVAHNVATNVTHPQNIINNLAHDIQAVGQAIHPQQAISQLPNIQLPPLLNSHGPLYSSDPIPGLGLNVNGNRNNTFGTNLGRPIAPLQLNSPYWTTPDDASSQNIPVAPWGVDQPKPMPFNPMSAIRQIPAVPDPNYRYKQPPGFNI